MSSPGIFFLTQSQSDNSVFLTVMRARCKASCTLLHSATLTMSLANNKFIFFLPLPFIVSVLYGASCLFTQSLSLSFPHQVRLLALLPCLLAAGSLANMDLERSREWTMTEPTGHPFSMFLVRGMVEVFGKVSATVFLTCWSRSLG